jgi:hypothetical protein
MAVIAARYRHLAAGLMLVAVCLLLVEAGVFSWFSSEHHIKATSSSSMTLNKSTDPARPTFTCGWSARSSLAAFEVTTASRWPHEQTYAAAGRGAFEVTGVDACEGSKASGEVEITGRITCLGLVSRQRCLANLRDGFEAKVTAAREDELKRAMATTNTQPH